MTDEPTILRSRTGADFLATLPTLAGFTAPDSLLLVPFRGKRTTGGVFRIDLEAFRRSPHLADAADGLVGALRRIPTCDAAVIVICADESFPVARLLWEPLWRALEEAMDEAGISTKDALLQTPDGWGSFYESDLAAEGRPLAEIDQSPLAAEAAESREGKHVRPYDADLTFPDPEPAFATALRDAVILRLDFEEVSDSFGVLSPAPRIDPLVLAENLLARSGPDAVSVPEYAQLIQLCALPATRDQLIVQIAFGRKAGAAVARDNARLHRIQGRTGMSMDEVVESELRAGRKGSADLDGALLGQTRRIPDRERLGRAIDLLRRAVPALQFADRGGPLCVLAWLEWAIGANTVAAALIADARRADPHLRMAGLLDELFRTLSPSWLYDRLQPSSPSTA